MYTPHPEASLLPKLPTHLPFSRFPGKKSSPPNSGAKPKPPNELEEQKHGMQELF